MKTVKKSRTSQIIKTNSVTFKRGMLFVFAFILLIAVGAYGYKIYESKFLTKYNSTTIYTVTGSTTYTSSEYFKYLVFQIKYSSKYFVTSDNMLTNYKSQGGSAKPRLVLSTVAQPLGSVTYDDLLSQNDGSCIVIWSTIGFNSLNEWLEQNNITNPITVSAEKITINGYTFEKRIVSSSARSQNIVVAYLSLPNNISYFFETNNTDSENDLVFILKNFNIRGDVE